jgi:hypothetical protein
MRSIWAVAIAGILALSVAPTAFAQEREKDESALGSRLRTGDRV